jgi:hypothetical protein
MISLRSEFCGLEPQLLNLGRHPKDAADLFKMGDIIIGEAWVAKFSMAIADESIRRIIARGAAVETHFAL